MRISRHPRARLPGRLAIVLNIIALAGIFGLLAIGEPSVRSASSSIMQIAGLGGSGSGGVTVDSSGRISYRSRTVTLEDLSAVIKRNLDAGGNRAVTVRADAKADSSKVAQVLRAAGRGGAQTVSLSIAQE